ncbi:MAG: hypothetical protein DRQ55_04805 [Planctomycetota bacterium]|nr:MAG: hypothetical protein DRQ55_04805 [Planctomycetota bacterium]
MSDEPRPLARQVLEDYATLEPGDSDSWNPLRREVELEHRVELLRRLTWALRAAEVDAEQLSVLDVGCGTGRSTRMYLELGLLPQQLTGIDLRPGALSRARRVHPAIRWLHTPDEAWPVEAGCMSWASLCTVLSSVRAPAARRELAAQIARAVPPGGHLFFWDRTHALDFAGADRLTPGPWFEGFEPVWESPARVRGYGPDDAGAAETHRAWLLRRV